jgi:hypothetical protein
MNSKRTVTGTTASHSLSRRRALKFLGASVLAAGLGPAHALAQDSSSKIARIIVPFAPAPPST